MQQSNIKSKRFEMHNYMKTALIIMMLLITTSCQSNVSVGEEIEKNLSIILNNPNASFSSNPNIYIEPNHQAYLEILREGTDGTEYLINSLKHSEENGLKEWIMAKACADILKDKNPVKEWSSGKEWLKKYEESQK
ncbi:hypothetical protein [Paenibacillus sp. PvR052]